MEAKREGRNLTHYYINDFIEEPELLWQIEEIANKGFNGIILAPARGLQIGFMSPEWTSIASCVLEIAKKKNLSVYLSTESVYPANILEVKYYYDIDDYKAKYLVLESEIQITEKIFINKILSQYDSLKLDNLHLFAIKKDKNGVYDSENYLYVDKYSLQYSPPSNDNWVLCVFCVKEANISSQGLYPFNFFVKNTTLEFVDKVYNKSIELFKKFSETFKGFYEPRLFPEVKCDKGVFWYIPIVKKFNEKFNIDLENCIPQLFFSESEMYKKVRKDYFEFLSNSYKKNFISVVDSFAANNELEIIYHCDNIGKSGYTNEMMHCSMLFDIESYGLNKRSSIAFSLAFSTANKVNFTNSLFFQTLNSLGIVKNPVAMVSDFHNRFNFSPHRLFLLKKYSLLFNFNENITSALLYSTKGFRKNDITPNLFCQTLFWKYIKRVNSDVKSTLEKFENDTIAPAKNNYDIAVVFSDDLAFKPIGRESTESPYFSELIENLFLNNKDMLFLPSSKIDIINLNKCDGKYVVSWKNKNITIKNVVVLCDLQNNQKINTLKSKIGGDNSFLTIDTSKKSGSLATEAIGIHDFAKINKSFCDDESEELSISCDSGVLIKKYGSDKNIYFNLLNTKDEPQKAIFKVKKGKKGSSFQLPLQPFAFESISLASIKNSVEKKDQAIETLGTAKYKIIFAKNWQFSSSKANILPLTTWIFKVGGPKDEEIGTVHFYESSFLTSFVPTKLSLILDGVWGEKDFANQNKPVKIFVNSQELPPTFCKFDFDHTLYKIDIANYVVKGENKIVIKSKGSHFSPITLNEPQFIEGDFVLKKKINDMWCIEKPERSLTNGNWVEEGYPFFLGYGCFEQFFELDKGFKKILLIMKKFEYPFEASLNGKDFIEVAAPPYRIDITQLVSEGKNKLTIKIPSSTVNIFTGTKTAEGLTGEVSLEIY